MKFENLNGKKDSSKVISDYIVTIKGLSALTKKMLKITDTVSIRRTTQDALENFFGGIRGVIYSPSVREFRGAYASMIVNNLSFNILLILIAKLIMELRCCKILIYFYHRAEQHKITFFPEALRSITKIMK